MTDIDLMCHGEITTIGRMPWSSNATFLVELTVPGAEDSADAAPDDAPSADAPTAPRAIYKPLKGERPLWDYPTGLYRREVAAHELSAFLGWDVIPRTVLREGPYGIGSLQLFIDADFEQHYFTIRDTHHHLAPQLRKLAAFDLVANSGDRKSGHVLIDRADGEHVPEGGGHSHIYGIDNGLSFHDEYKLRTVMWDYAGEELPEELLPDIERLANTAPEDLGPLTSLLSGDEIEMLLIRAHELLAEPVYPYPPSNYAYPWPMV